MKTITQATENRLNEMYKYIFSESGENWAKYTNVQYMPRVYGEAVALFEMLNAAKCKLGWDGGTISEMKKYGYALDNHMTFANVKNRYFTSAIYAMNYHYEIGKYEKFSVYFLHTLDLDSGYVDGFNEIVKFVYNRFCAYVKTTIDPITYYNDCIFGYVKNLPRWVKEAFEICGMLTEWAELETKFSEQEEHTETAQEQQPTEEHAEPETMPETAEATAETEKECRTMNKNIKIEYRWYKNNYDWYENPNTPETQTVIIEPDGDFENLLEINGVWCEYDEEADIYHVIEQDESGEYVRTGERYHIIRRTETDEELYY